MPVGTRVVQPFRERRTLQRDDSDPLPVEQLGELDDMLKLTRVPHAGHRDKRVQLAWAKERRVCGPA